MDEHGTKSDQPMYAHLTNCAQFAEYLKFYDIDAINTVVSYWKYRNYWSQW